MADTPEKDESKDMKEGQDASNAPPFDAPPMAPGFDAPPMAPGFDAPPMAPGFDAPPMAPGFDAPPMAPPAPDDAAPPLAQGMDNAPVMKPAVRAGAAKLPSTSPRPKSPQEKAAEEQALEVENILSGFHDFEELKLIKDSIPVSGIANIDDFGQALQSKNLIFNLKKKYLGDIKDIKEEQVNEKSTEKKAKNNDVRKRLESLRAKIKEAETELNEVSQQKAKIFAMKDIQSKLDRLNLDKYKIPKENDPDWLKDMRNDVKLYAEKDKFLEQQQKLEKKIIALKISEKYVATTFTVINDRVLVIEGLIKNIKQEKLDREEKEFSELLAKSDTPTLQNIFRKKILELKVEKENLELFQTRGDTIAGVKEKTASTKEKIKNLNKQIKKFPMSVVEEEIAASQKSKIKIPVLRSENKILTDQLTAVSESIRTLGELPAKIGELQATLELNRDKLKRMEEDDALFKTTNALIRKGLESIENISNRISQNVAKLRAQHDIHEDEPIGKGLERVKLELNKKISAKSSDVKQAVNHASCLPILQETQVIIREIEEKKEKELAKKKPEAPDKKDQKGHVTRSKKTEEDTEPKEIDPMAVDKAKILAQKVLSKYQNVGYYMFDKDDDYDPNILIAVKFDALELKDDNQETFNKTIIQRFTKGNGVINFFKDIQAKVGFDIREALAKRKLENSKHMKEYSDPKYYCNYDSNGNIDKSSPAPIDSLKRYFGDPEMSDKKFQLEMIERLRNGLINAKAINRIVGGNFPPDPPKFDIDANITNIDALEKAKENDIPNTIAREVETKANESGANADADIHKVATPGIQPAAVVTGSSKPVTFDAAPPAPPFESDDSATNSATPNTLATDIPVVPVVAPLRTSIREAPTAPPLDVKAEASRVAAKSVSPQDDKAQTPSPVVASSNLSVPVTPPSQAVSNVASPPAPVSANVDTSLVERRPSAKSVHEGPKPPVRESIAVPAVPQQQAANVAQGPEPSRKSTVRARQSTVSAPSLSAPPASDQAKNTLVNSDTSQDEAADRRRSESREAAKSLRKSTMTPILRVRGMAISSNETKPSVEAKEAMKAKESEQREQKEQKHMLRVKEKAYQTEVQEFVNSNIRKLEAYRDDGSIKQENKVSFFKKNNESKIIEQVNSLINLLKYFQKVGGFKQEGVEKDFTNGLALLKSGNQAAKSKSRKTEDNGLDKIIREVEVTAKNLKDTLPKRHQDKASL